MWETANPMPPGQCAAPFTLAHLVARRMAAAAPVRVEVCELTETQRRTVRALLQQEGIDVEQLCEGGRACCWDLRREGAAPEALEAAERAARACAAAAWAVVVPAPSRRRAGGGGGGGGATTARLG